jgi:hypothetical protein
MPDSGGEASRDCYAWAGGAGGPSAWQDLAAWCVAHGAQLDGVCVAEEGEGGGLRGVRTTRAVREHGVLFSVPRSLFLSVGAAEASPLLGSFVRAHRAQACLSDPARVLVALLLFEALRPHGFWAPYIRSLPAPDELEDFIDRWEERELALVQEPWLGTLAAGKRAECGLARRELLAAVRVHRGGSARLSEPPEVLEALAQLEAACGDEARYRWSFWMVESRAFLDRAASDSALPCLIPFGDMLNHNPVRSDHAEFDRSCFALVAADDCEAGQPVHNSYGRRSNRELLLSYGFCLDDNPWESVTVQLPWQLGGRTRPPLPHDGALERAKLALLQQYDGEEPGARLFLRGLSVALLWLFRVWGAATEPELARLRQGTDVVVSVSNELGALRAFAACVAAADTQASDVTQTPGAGPGAGRRRRWALARQYNASRHAIVQAWAAHCRSRTAQLAGCFQ